MIYRTDFKLTLSIRLLYQASSILVSAAKNGLTSIMELLIVRYGADVVFNVGLRKTVCHH